MHTKHTKDAYLSILQMNGQLSFMRPGLSGICLGLGQAHAEGIVSFSQSHLQLQHQPQQPSV